MATSHKKSGFTEKNSDNSRNNNGTLGGAGGVEYEAKGSFHKMTERAKDPEPNVRGIHENEENHMLGNHKYEGGTYAENEIDPNKRGNLTPDGKELQHPKQGYNHIDNPGGTSQEDVDKNN